MTHLDLQKLLDQTFFGIDVTSMLTDIEDFLAFSESNLSWQKLREIRKAERAAADIDFRAEDAHLAGAYRSQMIEGVEYRFDVSLTQRIRYAALSALVTTFDWCALTLERRAAFAIPKKPENTNRAVHVLRALNEKAGLEFEAVISEVERLVHVRNCVIHAAGLIDSYKYKDVLERSLSRLNGIRASKANLLGLSIEIEPGALESYLVKSKRWLPALDERCTEQGLLNI